MLQLVLPDVLYFYGKIIHPWLLFRIRLVSFCPFVVVWWAAMPVEQPDSIYPTFGYLHGGSSFQAATRRSLAAAARWCHPNLNACMHHAAST